MVMWIKISEKSNLKIFPVKVCLAISMFETPNSKAEAKVVQDWIWNMIAVATSGVSR